jgi:hypothetical protein
MEQFLICSRIQTIILIPQNLVISFAAQIVQALSLLSHKY